MESVSRGGAGKPSKSTLFGVLFRGGPSLLPIRPFFGHFYPILNVFCMKIITFLTFLPLFPYLGDGLPDHCTHFLPCFPLYIYIEKGPKTPPWTAQPNLDLLIEDARQSKEGSAYQTLGPLHCANECKQSEYSLHAMSMLFPLI